MGAVSDLFATLTPQPNVIPISDGSGTLNDWVDFSGVMVNPMTTYGDIVWGGVGGTPERLGIGTVGYVLTVGSSGAPEWAAAASPISPANPSSPVGLTAVNGVASTYMRSDAAPRLDQGIVPTWTGVHTFGNTIIQNLATGTPPTPPTGSVIQHYGADGVNSRLVMYAFGGRPIIQGWRANGTNASRTKVLSGDQIFTLGAGGYGATAYSAASGGAMFWSAAADWSDTSIPTSLTFIACPIGSTAQTTGWGFSSEGVLTITTAGPGVSLTYTPGTGMVINDAFSTGKAGTATGQVKFLGTTSGTVTLSVADAAGTWTMKLPTGAGSSGNVLTTDGSGNCSWSAAGTGSGTVNSGTATRFAYYATSTNAVSDTATMTVSATGRLAITPSVITSGSTPYLTITVPADTTLAAGTEAVGISIPGATRQFASNTSVTTQREINIGAMVYGFASSSGTITNAMALCVSAPTAGTNCSITNRIGIGVLDGGVWFGAIGTMGFITSTGGTGNLSLNAGGTNQGISFFPSGSGQVYVNTATSSLPTATLGIFGTTDATSRMFSRRASADAFCGGILFSKGRGSIGSPGAVSSGDDLGLLQWGGFDGTNWGENNARLHVNASQNWSTSAHGTKFQFFTTLNGATSTTSTAILLLDHDGSATFTPAASSLPRTTPYFKIVVPADTALTAGTEAVGISIPSATRQFASNTAITTQREILYAGVTYSFASSGGVITNGVGLAVRAPTAGTNCSITNRMGILVEDGGYWLGSIGTTASITSSGGNGGISLTAAGSNQHISIIPSGTGLVIMGPGAATSSLPTATAGVFGTSDQTARIFIRRASGDTAAAGLMVTKSRGTLGSPTAINSLDGMGGMNIGAFDGTNWVDGTVAVVGQATETWTSTKHGCRLAFATVATGTTTQTIGLWVENNGAVLASAPGAGLGYITGSSVGGTVTQGTSRTTGVTLNTLCGSITLVSAAGSATYQSFTVTNNTVAAADMVLICQKSGTDIYTWSVKVSAGSFVLSLATTGGTTTEQPVFTFMVLKGTTN